MSRTRILVADDSATIQKVFELAFENEDIEILSSSDGEEALKIIERTSPSMVIADVNMPGLDGFELCQALKKDEKSASIPVYLMSSALDDFDQTRSEEVGAAGRFEKPFRSEDMVTKVKAVISKIKGETPAEPDEKTSDDTEEDTFEDIDISLDTLLDSVEHRVDSSGEGDSDTIIENGDLDIGDEIEVGVDPVVIADEELGEPEIIDLDSSSLVSSDDGDDDEMDEEYLEVEIISGQADDDVAIEEVLEDELEPDMPVSDDEEDIPEPDISTSSILVDEIIEGPLPDLAFKDEELGQDNIDAEVGVDAIEEKISEEGRMMLEAIDDELDIDQTEVERELRAAGRIKDESAPAQNDVDNDKIMEMARKAFEEFVDNGGFHKLIDEAIERLVKEMLTKEVLEDAVSQGVKNAISEMRPHIMEDFKQIAQEMTLNVAEEMVRKTIDQIKVEQ